MASLSRVEWNPNKQSRHFLLSWFFLNLNDGDDDDGELSLKAGLVVTNPLVAVHCSDNGSYTVVFLRGISQVHFSSVFLKCISQVYFWLRTGRTMRPLAHAQPPLCDLYKPNWFHKLTFSTDPEPRTNMVLIYWTNKNGAPGQIQLIEEAVKGPPPSALQICYSCKFWLNTKCIFHPKND